jgi:hypothetical protein
MLPPCYCIAAQAGCPVIAGIDHRASGRSPSIRGVIAPANHIDAVLGRAAPIVDSIEFNAA